MSDERSVDSLVGADSTSAIKFLLFLFRSIIHLPDYHCTARANKIGQSHNLLASKEI